MPTNSTTFVVPYESAQCPAIEAPQISAHWTDVQATNNSTEFSTNFQAQFTTFFEAIRTTVCPAFLQAVQDTIIPAIRETTNQPPICAAFLSSLVHAIQ